MMQGEERGENRPCTRCGLADATCHLVITAAFARLLERAEKAYVSRGLCDRCWDELFGHISHVEEYVQRRRTHVGEADLEAARRMIEWVEWGEG